MWLLPNNPSPPPSINLPQYLTKSKWYFWKFNISAQWNVWQLFIVQLWPSFKSKSKVWKMKMAISQPLIQNLKTVGYFKTLKLEGNKVPFVFAIFDQGLRYGQSKNLQVFPFDVAYWKMNTLKAALPDWFGQKYLTGFLKYKN